MLVITRKVDQSIVVNGNIEVIVIGITKDGVRLGINAPKEVEVHRREVFDAIAEANRAASSQRSEPSPALQGAAALLRGRMPQVVTPKHRKE